MNMAEWRDILLTTARRIVGRQYKYFILDRTRVSEFEARHVMARVLEEFGHHYGIELQTQEKYITHCGLVDLVVFKNKSAKERLGWVEFKRSLAAEEKIYKDYEKMMMEPSLEFACFFHVLPQPKKGTAKKDNKLRRGTVLKRHENAYAQALRAVAKKAKEYPRDKEFFLFVLDCAEKEYFFEHFKDINEFMLAADSIWQKLSDKEAGQTAQLSMGKVDRKKEHIKLFYGDVDKKDEYELIAWLSPPAGNMFKVQESEGKIGSEYDKMRKEVWAELKFYMIDLKEAAPWNYAVYHCSTQANLRSKVHWAYYPSGDIGGSSER